MRTSQPYAELVGICDIPADIFIGDGAAGHVHVEQLHHVVRAVDDRLPLPVADPPHTCMQQQHQGSWQAPGRGSCTCTEQPRAFAV